MIPYSKTYTYKKLDAAFQMTKNIPTIMNGEYKVIPKEAIQLNMLNIEKTMSSPIKKQVLKAYSDGSVVPIIVKASIPFPNEVVFIPKKNEKGGITVYVNIGKYCIPKKSADGIIESITVNDTTLFTLISGGWFMYKYITEPAKLDTNSKCIKVLADAYSALPQRIYIAKYAANSSIQDADAMLAISAHFFAKYNCNSKYAADIANKNTFILDENVAKKVTSELVASDEKYENGLEDYIKEINKFTDNRYKVNPMEFIGQFGRLFGAFTPAIDYLPYLVLGMISCYCSGGIWRDQAAQSAITSKSINDFLKMIAVIYP